MLGLMMQQPLLISAILRHADRGFGEVEVVDELVHALKFGGQLPHAAAFARLLLRAVPFDAIADVLEIPLNTAASRYRYGLDKLRLRLRPLYQELQ